MPEPEFRIEQEIVVAFAVILAVCWTVEVVKYM